MIFAKTLIAIRFQKNILSFHNVSFPLNTKFAPLKGCAANFTKPVIHASALNIHVLDVLRLQLAVFHLTNTLIRSLYDAKCSLSRLLDLTDRPKHFY